MSNMHTYRYIDAKISNFIHRKLATLGDAVSDTSHHNATVTTGIYYEPLALAQRHPRKGAK
jgi:hypothetical protein